MYIFMHSFSDAESANLQSEAKPTSGDTQRSMAGRELVIRAFATMTFLLQVYKVL